MKLLTILLILVYFESSNAILEGISKLNIPSGFNISNVDKFKCFNALRFDGKKFNPFDCDLDDIFQRYAIKHNRNYTDVEKTVRRGNLRKTILFIAQFIIDCSVRNDILFEVGLNQLSDLSDEEYKSLSGTILPQYQTLTLGSSDRRKRSTDFSAICQPTTTSTLPSSLDWRTYNNRSVVTPVKYQNANCTQVIVKQWTVNNTLYTQYYWQCNTCGSCWAFASTATIESQWAMQTGQFIDLSEQDLVDCASTHGCAGDYVDTAYIYVISNGQAMEASVPYTATVETCNHYPLINGVTISDYCHKGGTYEFITTYTNGTVVTTYQTVYNSDNKIMVDLFQRGPVAVTIYAGDPTFQNYVSGIYNLPNCTQNSNNHAVTLIGWGIQNNVSYWIAKNSYSTAWGESGYIRIIMGVNMCGMNNVYYFPIMPNATPFNKTSG